VTEKTLSARQVLSRLNKLYEPPKTFLQWKTPLDLLVATLLSAQCTDAQVNKTTKKLFKKYRKPADYNAVSRKELERDVYSCGTYEHLRTSAVADLFCDQQAVNLFSTMRFEIEAPSQHRQFQRDLSALASHLKKIRKINSYCQALTTTYPVPVIGTQSCVPGRASIKDTATTAAKAAAATTMKTRPMPSVFDLSIPISPASIAEPMIEPR